MFNLTGYLSHTQARRIGLNKGFVVECQLLNS